MMIVLSRSHAPDVVVYARTTDHVSQIVKYCASKHLPVIPFGTGTGLEGTDPYSTFFATSSFM